MPKLQALVFLIALLCLITTPIFKGNKPSYMNCKVDWRNELIWVFLWWMFLYLLINIMDGKCLHFRSLWFGRQKNRLLQRISGLLLEAGLTCPFASYTNLTLTYPKGNFLDSCFQDWCGLDSRKRRKKRKREREKRVSFLCWISIKISFLTKFTFWKPHFWQNSRFQNLIFFQKITFFKYQF